MTEKAAATRTCQQGSADQWARFAADSYAEIVALLADEAGCEHRAKVREAHERALARGSDLL